MPETTPEMLAMARRIAAEMPGRNALQKHAFIDGQWDDAPAVQAALAAIKETTDLAVKKARETAHGMTSAQRFNGTPHTALYNFATALRNGEHYHD